VGASDLEVAATLADYFAIAIGRWGVGFGEGLEDHPTNPVKVSHCADGDMLQSDLDDKALGPDRLVQEGFQFIAPDRD